MEDQNERELQDFHEEGGANTTPPTPPAPPSVQSSSHTSSYYNQQEISANDNIPPLKPNTWLWQSILATILCCLPFGIVGIIYASKVDSLYFKGMYQEAELFSQKAKMWTIISFISALVYFIFVMILLVTGNIPEYMENIIERNASGYNF